MLDTKAENLLEKSIPELFSPHFPKEFTLTDSRSVLVQ